MKKKVLLSVLVAMVLVACSKAPETKSSRAASSSSSSVSYFSSSSSVSSEPTSQTSSSEEKQPESKKATITSASGSAQFNGSYYSVQGKYGEVLIVNKKHPLSSDYNPGEIPEAVASFRELVAQMASLGYDVSTTAYSGFRSYNTQASLYQSYVANEGQANADRYSARAGYSEHQTGLAYDILDTSGSLLTEPSATQWLAENAHRYGFIVRYLPGKEYSTGYMAESWHIRYVGKEAEDIYHSGLTLEEYFGVEGGDYKE